MYDLARLTLDHLLSDEAHAALGVVDAAIVPGRIGIEVNGLSICLCFQPASATALRIRRRRRSPRRCRAATAMHWGSSCWRSLQQLASCELPAVAQCSHATALTAGIYLTIMTVKHLKFYSTHLSQKTMPALIMGVRFASTVDQM